MALPLRTEMNDIYVNRIIDIAADMTADKDKPLEFVNGTTTLGCTATEMTFKMDIMCEIPNKNALVSEHKNVLKCRYSPLEDKWEIFVADFQNIAIYDRWIPTFDTGDKNNAFGKSVKSLKLEMLRFPLCEKEEEYFQKSTVEEPHLSFEVQQRLKTEVLDKLKKHVTLVHVDSEKIVVFTHQQKKF